MYKHNHQFLILAVLVEHIVSKLLVNYNEEGYYVL